MITEPLNWMEVCYIPYCLWQPFLNAHKCHTELIYTFTSMAFSDMVSLGYDPTIKRIQAGDGNIQYEYMMSNGITYVMVGSPLFDFRADVAEGHATQVWKVYRKAIPDVFHILKDLWMFSDATLEGDILRDLHQKVDEEHQRYFLTVLAHGTVNISSSCPDTTVGTVLRAIPEIKSRYAIRQPR